MARTKQRPASRRQASTSGAPRQAASLRPDLPVLAGALAGVGVTAYLTWEAGRQQAPALCAGDGGCAVIADSAWSMLLGMPLALWGLGLYALIALVAATGRSRVLRWRRLSRLTSVGLGVSVLLTLVGLVGLGAVCLWCLVSLALLAGLFARVHLVRPEAAPGVGTRWPTWWLGNGLAAVAVIAVVAVSGSGLLDRRPENPRLAALATHLADIDARYYGASWCSSCRQQSRVFGASAGRLPYVECSPEGRGGPVAQVCARAGVSSFPTWEIHGLTHVGVQTPEALAQLSGFDWEAVPEGE